MPLSASAIAELDNELEDLRRQRTRLNERIQALEKILHIDRTPETADDGMLTVVAKIVTDPPPSAQLPIRDLGMAPWGAPTVKSVVLGVLKENPGVKAAAITRILRSRNFRTNGPTRLSHRVYNELWRMARDGEITKTPDGRFFPAKEGAVQ